MSDTDVNALRFLIGFIISSICAIFVVFDCLGRRMNWILWPLFAFLCCPIGLIWYLIVRGPVVVPKGGKIGSIMNTPTNKKCPYCAETIKAEATVCKHCKSDFNSSTKKCPYCAEVINNNAVICEHCKSKLT